MQLIIKHFSKAHAEARGAAYYYASDTPRCPKCQWFSPRITETDECLSCKLETFVTLRSVAVGRGGRNARYVFSINTSRAAQKVFRDWPRVQAWVDQYLGRTKP